MLEFNAIFSQLVDLGWIVKRLHLGDFTAALTWEGWAQVEPVSGAAVKTVFVAMNFPPALDQAYEAIKLAIERVGLTSIRTDKESFAEKICDHILTEIHNAEFVVADFTNQSRGVYFEAGYVLALNKKLIWCCRDDDVENLHFDNQAIPSCRLDFK